MKRCLLILVFLSLSVYPHGFKHHFKEFFELRWALASEIHFGLDNRPERLEARDFAKNIWFLGIKAKHLDHYDCLYLKQDQYIQFHLEKSQVGCPKSPDKLGDFKVPLYMQRLIDFIVYKKDDQIVFSLKYSKNFEEVRPQFLNLKLKRQYRLGQSSQVGRVIPGIEVLGINSSIVLENSNPPAPNLKNKWKYCKKFNSKCQLDGIDSCDLCVEGSYAVISDCSKKVSFVCGVDHCGKKGMPACPRGELLGSKFGLLGCRDGSLSGFCGEGLDTYCVNQTLICL